MSITCPFCGSPRVTLVSLFGSQLLLSQYRCGACGTYFEGLREDRSQQTTKEASQDDRRTEL